MDSLLPAALFAAALHSAVYIVFEKIRMRILEGDRLVEKEFYRRDHLQVLPEGNTGRFQMAKTSRRHH